MVTSTDYSTFINNHHEKLHWYRSNHNFGPSITDTWQVINIWHNLITERKARTP